MAAYRRVYDLRPLQADCQEPGSAPGTLRSVIEYGRPFLPTPVNSTRDFTSVSFPRVPKQPFT